MICQKIDDCIKEINFSKKTLSDKIGGNSKYLIDNRSKSNYSIIDFENCVYENKQNDTRCDYGLKTDDTIFYIELKGSDVKKGIEQLLSTINESEKCFNQLNKKARLIITRFSKPNIVKKSKEYKDLVKKIGSIEHLVIKQDVYTEII